MDSPVNMSTRSKCSFSIEHILTVAGNRTNSGPIEHYEWLRCSRYHPPKLHRQKKKEGTQRRNPGRNPRIPFSSSQVSLLEAKFSETPYLSSSDVIQLASNLNLSEIRVKIWFQNRRARERRERENSTNSPTLNDTNKSPNQERTSSPNHGDQYIRNDTKDDSIYHGRHLWPNLIFPISTGEHWKNVANMLPMYSQVDQH